MGIFKIIVLFLISLLMQKVNSAHIRLQLEGINGNLQRNIHARLLNINLDEATNNIYLQEHIIHVVRIGLRALGYYSPVINLNFKPSTNNDNILIVHIVPGKPIKIAGINVILSGDAIHDIDYLQLIKRGESTLGSVLNHNTYDTFKNKLSSLALQKGYFDNKFNKNQLSVSLANYQAYWNISFDSGKRYHFGKIKFHGAQIDKKYLKNTIRLKEGEPYSIEKLAEINSRLIATNWFNSVVISPDFINSKRNKILSLNAVMTPKIHNSIKIGFGYVTDVGFRFKSAWNKPWLNYNGHSLLTSISLSPLEQLLNIDYKIPLLQDPLGQYFYLQSSFKHQDFNNIQTYSTMLNITRYWDLYNGWQRIFNLRWSIDHFAQAKITNFIALIYPGIRINRIRQCSDNIPSCGNSQNYTIDVSHIIWGSDINFIIFQTQNIWIYSLAKKHRFVTRYNLGWIETNDFEHMPPLLRFFAGGDRSIRGYKYKTLSPQNKNGTLIGASKLITGSIEYQYNFTNRWWTALFIDSGEVVNNIKENNIKIGTGVGMRWQSPVGTIKLDIATAVADKYKHGIQFYIGLGSEL